MTTFPISGPPVTPATEQIGLLDKSTYMESPFTGAQVTTTQGYRQWQVTISFPPVTAAEANLFMGWLDSLEGQRGYFTYRPIGSGLAITGKTLNAAANQGTNIINVGGWSAGAATGLSVGNFFSLGTSMFRITSVAANANGSGVAAVSFVPAVRTTVASGTSVNFATPSVQLRVSSGDQAPAVSRDPDSISLPTLGCFEVH